MDEQAWFSSLIPQTLASHTPSPPPQVSRHRRQESLLKQPPSSSEIARADDEAPPAKTIADIIVKPEQRGPPEATVARRAKSYSNFYDAVRAYTKKERRKVGKRRSQEWMVPSRERWRDWDFTIAEELVDASHEEYDLYHQQLQLMESHLDSILADTNSALTLLSELTSSFKAVGVQTTAFRSQCEGLLADTKRIDRLADDVRDNVQYYTYLEPITRRLNAPGAGNHVRNREFSEMLVNLDNCLEYMQAHPTQKEASTYRARYRLLLTRALTLIRGHFTNSLKEIAADVSKRIADRQLNDTTMSALLYAKFRVGASDLKRIGMEIQKRAVLPAGAEPGAEAEYQSLMNELYQSYLATRSKLMLPLITKRMQEIAAAPSTAKDLIAFARSSISYIQGVCADEYDLWFHWFDAIGGLYDLLESLIEPFHDHLRPRTVHEPKLERLCELCTLIQTRYMEQDEDDEEPVSGLDFADLIQPSLEDAQTRLVFLAGASLRNDIENFRPKPEDLDYPARNRQNSVSGAKSSQPVLSGRRDPNRRSSARKESNAGSNTPPPSTPIVVEDDETLRFDFNTEPMLEDWYPTLRKAIWLLSRIYRLVNSTVFDDLAHRIVHATTLSLVSASSTISTRVSPTDGQLFLIKHLLLLKQQIVAFDIEFTPPPEVGFEFSAVTSTFWELRERGGLFNPANLVRLAAGSLVPRVVENMLDAKGELDGRLRAVINDLTTAFVARMTGPITPPASTKKTFDAEIATAAVRENMGRDVEFLRMKLDEYVDDLRTRETLVAAVHERFVIAYEQWFEEWAAGESQKVNGGGKLVKPKGKGRVDEVWDPQAVSEWSVSVFGLEGLEELEEDGEGSRRGSL